MIQRESPNGNDTYPKVDGSTAHVMDIPSNVFSNVILETGEGKLNWMRPLCCFVLLM